MQLFHFKVRYYSEYNDEYKEDDCLVFGKDIPEACKNFEEAGYEFIDKLEITTICDDCTPNVIYLPKDTEKILEAIKDANYY